MKHLICVFGVLLGVIGSSHFVWADCSDTIKNEIATALGNCNDEHCKMDALTNEFNTLGLYGTQSSYIRQFCLLGDAQCNVPPPANSDPTHASVFITLATDDSYTAAQGVPDLATAKADYQCVKDQLVSIVGPNNVVENAPVAIAPVQAAGGNNNNQQNQAAGSGALKCQSSIFDCNKPLAIYPVPIGNYCSSFALDVNPQEQILWISGDKMTMVVDPRSQKAVFCSDKNPAPCNNNSDQFYPIGKNEDGSTHMLVADGKIWLNPAAAIQKIIDSQGQTFLEAMTNAANTPLCDDVFKDAKADIQNAASLPDINQVQYNGNAEPVKTPQAVLSGSRAIVVLTSSTNSNVIGMGVMTIGDTPSSSQFVFKKAPEDIIATGYTKANDLAITAIDDHYADVSVSLAKGGGPSSVLSCTVPLDDTTPMSCDPSKTVVGNNAAGAGPDPALVAMLHSQYKQKSFNDTGDEKFGDLLATQFIHDVDQKKVNVGQAVPDMVIHGFEGLPDALVVNLNGNQLYRTGKDSTVALDPFEMYPGARKCFLTDLDNYGGKDLFCIADQYMYFLPKINQPPQLDKIDLTPAVNGQSGRFQPSAQTQEGENLIYHWQVYQLKDDKSLVDESSLLSAADVANPTLNMPIEAASSVTPTKVVNSAALSAPDVNVSAGMTKSVKAMGIKDATSGAPSGSYFAVLTVTDPGGMSVTGLVPIMTKGLTSTAATPHDATSPSVLPSASPSYSMLGGCTLVQNVSTTVPMALLGLLLMPFAILIPVRVRVKSRHK